MEGTITLGNGITGSSGDCIAKVVDGEVDTVLQSTGGLHSGRKIFGFKLQDWPIEGSKDDKVLDEN